MEENLNLVIDGLEPEPIEANPEDMAGVNIDDGTRLVFDAPAETEPNIIETQIEEVVAEAQEAPAPQQAAPAEPVIPPELESFMAATGINNPQDALAEIQHIADVRAAERNNITVVEAKQRRENFHQNQREKEIQIDLFRIDNNVNKEEFGRFEGFARDNGIELRGKSENELKMFFNAFKASNHNVVNEQAKLHEAYQTQGNTSAPLGGAAPSQVKRQQTVDPKLAREIEFARDFNSIFND